MTMLAEPTVAASSSVSEAVLSRRSIRAFKDQPVPLEVLRRVLDKARWAPSGCNFQPWEATVISGAPLAELQQKILSSPPQDPIEYSFSDPEVIPECKARLQQVGAAMYTAMEIGRGDKDARMEFMRQNATSFGAPAVLMCYFDRRNGPPQWSDVGMWLQTIMLLLREEGLDSCPQEFMSLYARLIKEFIGVSDETHIFFCGIAIGYRQDDAAVNGFEREREPLDGNVRFMGF
ncbi:nitroreductase [Novosphingobium sp. KCTC 2891]|uniref:nitroreductase n=1 Tax=Novosphingobium sp. KCTC 2891 TaxID=2989730 RepID=UPI002222C185|nr:nitroreductase [Novosphingobium sp. KCTC 2891]MCW1381433.1 nitroreductase [Novosphingobium sp. KCTC 2891]